MRANCREVYLSGLIRNRATLSCKAREKELVARRAPANMPPGAKSSVASSSSSGAETAAAPITADWEPVVSSSTGMTHVAVIGAGVAGLGAAWHLSRSPDVKVTVFEPCATAGGHAATGARGRDLRSGGRNARDLGQGSVTHCRDCRVPPVRQSGEHE